ncbi:hypothetical protein FEI17_11635 [Kosakonia radicincitans]|uniref:hypothetical protein n=1 Tax=Kosakonia radicincitans TaxID=283686 RepID=UPI0011EC2673|nr:hypothetical protein [Kosakonia radicincitans]MDD7997653.1 hypothetical protein [Kosakonia radicincitans]QEM91241.1 hypothetical protein FEI17_11635 [Kosakonia radicincitans]
MIEAKIIYSQRGNFVLMRSAKGWIISVLISSFYPNSHFDVSKDFLLTDDEVTHKEDVEYLKKLAENIRKDWGSFSNREVSDVKIVR